MDPEWVRNGQNDTHYMIIGVDGSSTFLLKMSLYVFCIQIVPLLTLPLSSGRILKRTSSSTSSSPYSRSTTTFYPPPHHAASAKSTLRPTKSDNHLRTAKSVSDVKTDRENSVQASLKHSRSKRFVQSVWTKEFCKLMDLRMYNHT